MRKHSHSWRLKTCGVLARSFVSRTATPPSGRCAISTHPPVLLALLLNQRSPVRSVSIRLSFPCTYVDSPECSDDGHAARQARQAAHLLHARPSAASLISSADAPGDRAVA